MVERLKNERNRIQRDADERIEKVNSRIRIADALIGALEKGTLKP